MKTKKKSAVLDEYSNINHMPGFAKKLRTENKSIDDID